MSTEPVETETVEAVAAPLEVAEPAPATLAAPPVTDDPATTVTAAPEPPIVVNHPASDIVEHWFRTTFPGSPVLHSTEDWNFIFAAVEDLKRTLNATL